MNTQSENSSLETASNLVAEVLGDKPRLFVRAGDLPSSAYELRDRLAATGRLFDRGTPIRLVPDKLHGGVIAKPLTLQRVIIEAHEVCQPYRMDGSQKINITLPDK